MTFPSLEGNEKMLNYDEKGTIKELEMIRDELKSGNYTFVGTDIVRQLDGKIIRR